MPVPAADPLCEASVETMRTTPGVTRSATPDRCEGMGLPVAAVTRPGAAKVRMAGPGTMVASRRPPAIPDAGVPVPIATAEPVMHAVTHPRAAARSRHAEVPGRSSPTMRTSS